MAYRIALCTYDNERLLKPGALRSVVRQVEQRIRQIQKQEGKEVLYQDLIRNLQNDPQFHALPGELLKVMSEHHSLLYDEDGKPATCTRRQFHTILDDMAQKFRCLASESVNRKFPE